MVIPPAARSAAAVAGSGVAAVIELSVGGMAGFDGSTGGFGGTSATGASSRVTVSEG
jgi:hypothetical protein